MKKGFTLMEMIAVIVIISIITLTVLPSVLNQLSNNKDKISETSKNVIYTATSLYLQENTRLYPKVAGKTYCGLTLEALVNDGKLVSPVKDLSTGDEIPLNKVIKVYVNSYSDYEYCLVDSNDTSCNVCVAS